MSLFPTITIGIVGKCELACLNVKPWRRELSSHYCFYAACQCIFYTQADHFLHSEKKRNTIALRLSTTCTYDSSAIRYLAYSMLYLIYVLALKRQPMEK